MIDRWQTHIREASRRFGIPEAWIRAVINEESAGRTMLNGRPITSNTGAIGLMQVMPGTYSDLRKQYGFGLNSYDPRDNILAGTAYLRQMYDRFGYPSLFAAYNAGPKRFEDFVFAGKSLSSATFNYVERILTDVGTTFDRVRLAGPIAPDKLHPRTAKEAIRDLHNSLFFVRSEPQSGAKTESTQANLTTDPKGIFANFNGQDHTSHNDSRDEIFVLPTHHSQ